MDVGLQLGGKAFVEVLFFPTEEALEDFNDGSYEVAANATAVALKKEFRYINFQNGVAVMSMPKPELWQGYL